jgi:hypothetical protein
MGTGRYLLGGSKIKRAEYDLPGEVHGVPELRLENAECGCIAPKGRYVSRVGCECLERALGVGAEICGELVEGWAGGECVFDCSVGVVGRDEGLGKLLRERNQG